MAKNIITIKNLCKIYDDDIILDNIDLYVKEHEFLTLLGPSGCGKTTLLRIIGGFESPTSGNVLLDGKDMANVPPYERQVNTVFQRYALFPHMNVYENIAFGLRIKKLSNNVINEKVKKLLKLVNLDGYEKREVNNLSGGQQQRIAMARALANEPRVLLLDEPLSALDLKLRKEMQTELINMQWELGTTFIYVTHDQEEALTLSDTVVLLNEGRIQQIGTPLEIYNEPNNAFVAGFLGESNIIDGLMHDDLLVEFLGVKFKCVDKGFKPSEKVDVVIRPEDIILMEPDKGKLRGIIDTVVFKGVFYEILIVIEEHTFMVRSINNYEEGKSIGMDLAPDSIHVMRKGN